MKKILQQKSFYFIFLLTVLQSCNSQDENKNFTKKNESFDLANLALNENINDILSSTLTLLKDTLKVDDYTYIGNERLVFSKKNLLVFNNETIFNKNNEIENQVIFHYGKVDKDIGTLYNEKDNILGMYQIKILTNEKADLLLKSLNKKNKEPKKYKLGNVEAYHWLNNDLYYYFFIKKEETNDEFLNVLFVFKKIDKEWIDFIGTLGYSDSIFFNKNNSII